MQTPPNIKTNNKQNRNMRFVRITILIVIAGLIFGTGYYAGQSAAGGEPKTPDVNLGSLFNTSEEVEFSLIEEAWDAINNKYVDIDEVNKDELIFGAIQGMVEKLDDPHTVFLPPKESKRFRSSVKGEFEGVGIEIGIRDDVLTVITPLKGNPAERAGIQAGDKIVKIDGESTEGITIDEAVSKIRGEKGTEVVLTVERESAEATIDIPITRDTIEVPSVTHKEVEEGISYIEITNFTESTTGDFKDIAQQILENGTNGMILDLRNNPGGFLDASVQISGWFIEEGKVVVKEARRNGEPINHTSSGPASLKDMPVVVLINKGSASASEIVAGALRDQKNNVEIVGEQSFGKGSVQSLENLSGGTSLKVTIARWLTPNNVSISEKGISPTIKVEQEEGKIDTNEDKQLNRAIEILQQ